MILQSLSRRSAPLLLAGLLALSVAACGAAPATSASATPATAASSATSANAATDPPASASTQTKLNLNAVSADDLLNTIPGFSNRMVREFQEYRPYVSLQQFRREMGKYVDEAQVAEYEKYVYVPITLNDSDAATLQQIPGLDAAEAAELIAGRPYASTETFLAKLTGYVSAAELAVAKTYLGNP